MDIRFLFIILMAFLGRLPLLDLADIMIVFYVLFSITSIVIHNEFALITSLNRLLLWLGVFALCKHQYFISFVSLIIALIIFNVRSNKFSDI